MSSISTYIFVHDQQIILDCEASGKFKDLPSLKYVFLGQRPIDKISAREDVIIARNLEHNIEQHYFFCSFTGWYALWKNDLIKTDYVNLFEYDIDIQKGFAEKAQEIISEKYNFIGYIPLPIAVNFINSGPYSSGLRYSIGKHYNIDGLKMVRKMKKENRKSKWSSTSNSTFDAQTFNEYMAWFEKLINDLKEDKLSGHAHERSLTIFCFTHNKSAFITEGILTHRMANSHGLTC